MSQVIVVTSGKGGVKNNNKRCHQHRFSSTGKTVVVDFDVGLRNLDLIMGCERVVYDLINVINGEINIQQALIKDKQLLNLFVLPASQTRDKDALKIEGVKEVIDKLKALTL